jgi:hypothetical protein
MPFACTIVIGLFCIQGPIVGTTTATHEDIEFYLRDTVSYFGSGGKKWSIVWDRYANWPGAQRLDSKRMVEACQGSVCHFYWRKCVDNPPARKCTYTIDAGEGAPAQIILETNGEDAWKDAMQHVFLNTDPPIPFSTMNQDGEGDKPPITTEQSSQPPR